MPRVRLRRYLANIWIQVSRSMSRFAHMTQRMARRGTSEAGALRDEPSESDKKNRVDLRKLGLVTIDGEDAQDFDDAVYCETEGSGFGFGSPLPMSVITSLSAVRSMRRLSIAVIRCTSPGCRCFPNASNGLCSLKPAVDHLAMVCEMLIDADGKD